MKSKSKVTSIRVEPELYNKFKKTVELQNKQVSSVVSEFMSKHIEQHEMKMELFETRRNRIKVGFDKIKNEIDWSKVSRYSFTSISNFNPNWREEHLESVCKYEKENSGFKNAFAYILDTEDPYHIDILLLESKEAEKV